MVPRPVQLIHGLLSEHSRVITPGDTNKIATFFWVGGGGSVSQSSSQECRNGGVDIVVRL